MTFLPSPHRVRLVLQQTTLFEDQAAHPVSQRQLTCSHIDQRYWCRHCKAWSANNFTAVCADMQRTADKLTAAECHASYAYARLHYAACEPKHCLMSATLHSSNCTAAIAQQQGCCDHRLGIHQSNFKVHPSHALQRQAQVPSHALQRQAQVPSSQVFKQDGRSMIRLGDSDVEYHPNFQLYMTTPLPNPHYLPEVCIKVTLVNFTVTGPGLEEQLLAELVRKERPDLQASRDRLLLSISNDKRQLKVTCTATVAAPLFAWKPSNLQHKGRHHFQHSVTRSHMACTYFPTCPVNDA